MDRQSHTYGEVITTLPVGAVGTVPHHTEYEMPADGVLWANGFAAGRTFRLDLRDPTRPRLAGSFGDAGLFSHPHSFARLPNGHVLATFQHRTEAGVVGTGGLVELDTAGGRRYVTRRPARPGSTPRFGPTAWWWCPRSTGWSAPPPTCTWRCGAGRFRSGACPT